jgi:xanthine dehydrogenase iron-sulfur cluster and FAD-binding subunit A
MLTNFCAYTIIFQYSQVLQNKKNTFILRFFCRSLVALAEYCHYSSDFVYQFCSLTGKQIRNVAAVGGNIMTGSPISDLNPILMAAGAVLTLQSAAGGRRDVPFDAAFYTGYRRNIVRPDEVLVSIRLPFPPSPRHFFTAYKQARRRDDDIAIVNAAFSVHVEPLAGGPVRIAGLRMAFGGMAPTTVLAERTAAQLVGFEVGDLDGKGGQPSDPLVEAACRLLTDELTLGPGAPGALIRYRRSLVLSFFFKFYLELRRYLPQSDLQRRSSAAIRSLRSEMRHSSQGQCWGGPSSTRRRITRCRGRPSTRTTWLSVTASSTWAWC